MKWKVHLMKLSFFVAAIISFSFCKSSAEVKESKPGNQSLSVAGLGKPDSESDTISDIIMIKNRNRSVLRYDLENPDEKYLMPKSLVEISGLTYYSDDRILCIQDESAIIYNYSLAAKEITNKYQFGQNGDYEDIAVVDHIAYVIRSDGKILMVKDFDKEGRKVTELKTPLSRKNNTEGIAYDKISNSLFIACKGSSEIKNNNDYEEARAVYRFDLETNKLFKEPAFLIDLESLYDFRENKTLEEKNSNSVAKNYLAKRDAAFKPSGISINPLSDQIYLISHVGKKLIIVDRDGKILDFYDLNPKIFLQPEGICFSPAGDLFISSEGDGGKGYILRFNNRAIKD